MTYWVIKDPHGYYVGPSCGGRLSFVGYRRKSRATKHLTKESAEHSLLTFRISSAEAESPIRLRIFRVSPKTDGRS